MNFSQHALHTQYPHVLHVHHGVAESVKQMGQVNSSSRRVSRPSVFVLFFFGVLRLFLIMALILLLLLRKTMKQRNETATTTTTGPTWRTWLLLTLITAVIVLEAAVRHFNYVSIAWAQLALCFLGFLIVLDDFLGAVVMRHVITPWAQWLGKKAPPTPSSPQEKQQEEVVEETKDPQQRRRSTRLRDNPKKNKNE